MRSVLKLAINSLLDIGLTSAHDCLIFCYHNSDIYNKHDHISKLFYFSTLLFLLSVLIFNINNLSKISKYQMFNSFFFLIRNMFNTLKYMLKATKQKRKLNKCKILRNNL